jgi:acetyltransferase-like isoleucine patch superfamily enzyme
MDGMIPFLRSNDPRVRVGDYTYGDPEFLLWDDSERIEIGKFCSIADNVTIFSGGEHRQDWISTYPFRIAFGLEGQNKDGHPQSKGPTIIENDVWIGFGAVILSGVTVGNGAIIGARSVVTKDVPAYHVVGGNPAKVIRQRFSDVKIEKLLRMAWWDWPLERILKAVPILCSDRLS